MGKGSVYNRLKRTLSFWTVRSIGKQDIKILLECVLDKRIKFIRSRRSKMGKMFVVNV
ncbi:hypothetical protein [Candidatus Vidania fulgoroideorum]